VEQAVSLAKKLGATFADARVVVQQEQFISTEDRRVEGILDSVSSGIGIRVIVNGSFGFAATRELTPQGADATAGLAVEVGKASATLRKGPPVSMADEPPHRDRFVSPRTRDPFEISCGDKARQLLAANEIMLKVKGIGKATSFMHFSKQIRTMANTDGSLIETDMLRTESGINAVALAAGDAQSRSYGPPPMAGGFELVEQAAFGENAERAAEEAIEKLKAKPCSDGSFDLILLPSHMWLTIHESIGHATELDRVLGMEESLSGGSFASLDQLGKLKYGSPQINIRAINAKPGLLASTGYDDDGVKCQDWDIIRQGILVGYSSNREVVHAMGEKRSRGACRADSWLSIPILRMANVCLMPGRERLSLDDLIADTKRGILIDGDGSYSIDNRRLNFQFGGDAFFEIQNGKKIGMLRDVTYQAITPQFWGSCDAVCDERAWRPFGTFYCGKGDPMQTSQISHACAPARFRGVTVRRAV
jgi:TldD protein